MVVLAIIALLWVLSLRMYQQYQWQKNANVVKQGVSMLLQAAAAYYQENCSSITPPQGLACSQLAAAGGFSSLSQCALATQNPWGKSPLAVSVVQDPSATIYLLQVSATFDKLSSGQLSQVAATLGTDASSGGSVFTWTRVPDMSVIHNAIGTIYPGGSAPSTDPMAARLRVSSNLWLMKGDLESFAKSEPKISGPGIGVPCGN